MQVVSLIDIHVLSMLILSALFVVIKQQASSFEIQHSFFIQLMAVSFANLFLEALGWILDGRPGAWMRVAVYGTNTLFLLCNPMFLGFWLKYLVFYLHRDVRLIRARQWRYFLPVPLFAALLLVNLKTGFMFVVDAGNHYVRGEGFWVLTALSLSMAVVAIGVVVRMHGKAARSEWYACMVFNLLPLAGGLFQVLNFGAATLWPSSAFAILVIFLHVEMKHLAKDHLTGINNRRKLDSYLEYRMKQDRPFSLVMIDLDGFKSINDSYGHDAGDEALRQATRLIGKNLRKRDFIARFAGDEFVIVVDSDTQTTAWEIVTRIHRNVAEFNQRKIFPFPLSMSIGFEHVERPADRTLRQVLNAADLRMYEEKRRSAGP